MRKKYLLLTVAVLFCSAFLISHFWFQFVLIQGTSMIPSYRPWQLATIYKRADTLESGDVIAFQCDSLNALLIKRIVACPGDTVQIQNGILYINGSQKQPVSIYGSITYAGTAQDPITLSADEYFVLGDNIEDSKDSRYPEIGCIKKKDIWGIITPQIPLP